MWSGPQALLPFDGLGDECLALLWESGALTYVLDNNSAGCCVTAIAILQRMT